mmetsp:Transcript_30410/g.40438  ORF Transcript_30410/g.40438 Transcript_30410/m.40438 type:complete len:88 (+) Transcript_30410:2133-2396(+)
MPQGWEEAASDLELKEHIRLRVSLPFKRGLATALTSTAWQGTCNSIKISMKTCSIASKNASMMPCETKKVKESIMKNQKEKALTKAK